MSQTTNYNLALFDSITEMNTQFAAYVEAISGNVASSNMAIIDAELKSNLDGIEALAVSISEGLIRISTFVLLVNTETEVFSMLAADYTSAEISVQISQGDKKRISKIMCLSDGTDVDMWEFAVMEMNDSLSDLNLDLSASGLNCTITDAASTNATIKIRYIITT